jgi:hypothetical protein
MTIDLDERWPHTAGAECSKYPVVCDRDCTRDARIAAHIERVERIADAARRYRWCENNQDYKAPECRDPQQVDDARAALDAALKAWMGET